jgi:hypothetical protein
MHFRWLAPMLALTVLALSSCEQMEEKKHGPKPEKKEMERNMMMKPEPKPAPEQQGSE